MVGRVPDPSTARDGPRPRRFARLVIVFAAVSLFLTYACGLATPSEVPIRRSRYLTPYAALGLMRLV
ncbi:hypothetical protein AWC06_20690 [Mycobacterium fragae]|uniref:Uncharacterized protein n=1 Tax=Mycobacterium fragae TaxID=1260918 RepID=A0A1X1UMW9_9MYCO|nr:hypothetical protein AWC06_20690 [Mycobacterium fragae]